MQFTDIPSALSSCADDLTDLHVLTLEAQVRAYHLLDALLADSAKTYKDMPCYASAADEYTKAFEGRLAAYDEDMLRKELETNLAVLDAELNEARFRAAASESLHEFAKEVWEIWQNSGVFARRRALKELRHRAGFRLESHRIGNYVAKTFDLMNEAHARFAKAQQAKFSADVSYMIQPDIHNKIRELL